MFIVFPMFCLVFYLCSSHHSTRVENVFESMVNFTFELLSGKMMKNSTSIDKIKDDVWGPLILITKNVE